MKYRKKKNTKFVSKAVKKFVKHAIAVAPELKAYNNINQVVNPSATWGIFVPESISQGLDDNNRIADHVKVQNVSWRAQIWTSTGATVISNIQNSSRVRIVVFKDRFGSSQPTGQGTASTSLMLTNSINSNYNFELKDRYDIVYDKIHEIMQGVSTNSLPNNVAGVRDIIHTFKQKYTIEYLDTTGTLPSQNRLYVAYITDSLGTSQVISLQQTFRYFFTDT